MESMTPVSERIPEKDGCNQEIVRRYLDGARAVDLTSEFGIAVRPVNRLIRHYLSRG